MQKSQSQARGASADKSPSPSNSQRRAPQWQPPGWWAGLTTSPPFAVVAVAVLRIAGFDRSLCAPLSSPEGRMQTWLRRKDIDKVCVHEEGRRLVPTLSWPHLVALGIGAIVGTGIYTLIGV